jgi:hypothetical protein
MVQTRVRLPAGAATFFPVLFLGTESSQIIFCYHEPGRRRLERAGFIRHFLLPFFSIDDRNGFLEKFNQRYTTVYLCHS